MTMPGSCSSGFRSRPSARGGQQPLEGVGGEQREQEEAAADQAHHAEHARQHALVELAREQRHGEGPARQDQRPQQDRALVVAPDGGELVDQRQQAVGMVGRQRDREVVGDEGPGQAAVGDQQEQELRRAPTAGPARSRRRCRCRRRSAAARSGSSAMASARISAKWPSSGIMVWLLAVGAVGIWPWRAFSSASAASGGM